MEDRNHANLSIEHLVTHLRMLTLPIALAVILPPSSTVNWATMLSIKNKPSGSFFPTAYHVPAYYKTGL